MPAGEMWRFGRALPSVLFAFAHRAFCAADMRRRAAADIVRPRDDRGVLPFSEASAVIALSNLSRSCRSSLTTASRFAMRGIVALAEFCLGCDWNRQSGSFERGKFNRRTLDSIRVRKN